jgi:hypothetical protein
LERVAELDRILAYVDTTAGKPLMVKTLGAVLYLHSIIHLVPNSRFLYVQRRLLDTARSIFHAKRRERKSPETVWYVVPPALCNRRFETEAHQIAAQVRAIHQLVIEGFSELSSERYLTVQYEDLCRNPQHVVARVAQWLGPDVRLRAGARVPPLSPAEARPLTDVALDRVFQQECG